MKIVPFSPNPESGAKVVGYLHDVCAAEMPNRTRRPCVVIFPGGGYVFLSARESDPPAAAFFAKGYQVFLLDYSIGEQATDFRPLIDASLTLMKIRENAAEWGILPDRIAVLGFSAGGHAAAGLGTLWDSPALKKRIDTKGGRNRPDAMVLCYPVITMGELTHPGSRDALLGKNPTEEMIRLFSLENQVGPGTPPAFLWHTVEDRSVPVENTLMFAAALRRNRIPFECHLYPKGAHGLSMCNAEVHTENPHCATWFPLCAEWLGELFQFPY